MEPRAISALESAGAGMQNAGNSCYMAASLQALLRVPHVAQLIWAEHGPCDEFVSILRGTLSKTFGIDEQKKPLTGEDTNELRHIFEWLGWDKKDHEADALTFIEFLLPILNLTPFAVTRRAITKPLAPPSQHTLMHSIGYANNTQTMQEFISPYKLFSTCIPDLLPIAIGGRFSVSKEKNCTRITPSELLELNLADAPSKKVAYQLVAIVVYIGEKMSGGHYVTFARKGHQWVEYNDSRVIQHQESHTLSQILETCGYIHIYSRLP